MTPRLILGPAARFSLGLTPGARFITGTHGPAIQISETMCAPVFMWLGPQAPRPIAPEDEHAVLAVIGQGQIQVSITVQIGEG